MALAAAAPTAESRRLHFTLTAVYETLMDAGVWPAALKAALNMIGLPAGVPREPVPPLGAAAEAALRTSLRDLTLIPWRCRRHLLAGFHRLTEPPRLSARLSAVQRGKDLG